MAKEYSLELCQYIGRIELRAFEAKDSFARFMVYHDALDSLRDEKFPKEDSLLVQRILLTRLDKDKPE